MASEIVYIFVWVGGGGYLDIIWTCNGIPWEFLILGEERNIYRTLINQDPLSIYKSYKNPRKFTGKRDFHRNFPENILRRNFNPAVVPDFR